MRHNGVDGRGEGEQVDKTISVWCMRCRRMEQVRQRQSGPKDFDLYIYWSGVVDLRGPQWTLDRTGGSLLKGL